MNAFKIRGFGYRKNLYWNGCGWTEFKNSAQTVGLAEGNEKIARMEKDRIMAELVPL